MRQIVPALLVKSGEEFEQQLRLVEHDCSLIQVDALDGTLFPNTNWFNAEHIGSLSTNVEIELHLMVENPIPIVEMWKKYVPTFTRAIVHAEMHRPLAAVVDHIQHVLKIGVGVAINPETPLSEAEDVLHVIDQLTIMSVHPGLQGQVFGDREHLGGADAIFEKIHQVKLHRPDLLVEIDGGITRELIKPLAEAGIDRFGIGSLIFASKDPTATLKELNTLVNTL
ncbi:hypothetical protein CO174_01895 [Candidatus Uhrbacteria bacterium CG_4_9_14_3_um_filter_50_9]|uniref:Ribulose-phosphate 3-epimerase n=1 Tax=Candidatus Uhrbacteria bacterium CG_4_9_14_3_um_filter_50_9 TaxID=1975035 RepID=A0A2M7XCS3_9BACT|nr:MAG: hypothetical protein CO174_01895 [Candidatus Uhrbacteria bacterium CG_4_9_14_3_um_filter_50_9]